MVEVHYHALHNLVKFSQLKTFQNYLLEYTQEIKVDTRDQ